ncbi:S8 family peptidase [Rhizobium sp. RAF56]|uniref:S8 family peptidase n=1 Tax=Rhizobium sp. RAF56 TaxID=3233062 RepID=UPI003F9626DC
MNATTPIALLSVCVAATVLTPALAEDSAEGVDPKFIEARDLGLPSSYIWFNQGNLTPDEVAANIKTLGDAFVARGILYRTIKVGEVEGLLVAANSEELQDEIRSNGSIQRESIRVEPNPVLTAFGSDCTDASRNYSDPEITEWGVKLVWHGGDPTAFSVSGKAVWIIDSGVSDEFTGSELNLVSRLNCLKPNCPPDNKKDRIGHGTMTAGIIGAKTGNMVGVRGVAPFVAINSMRVVKGRKGEVDSDAVVEALNYLIFRNTADADPTTPSPGDVINLSYGAVWTAASETIYSAIEMQLRKLADLGFRISLAAGNTDVTKNTGYVQTISPARAGGYRAASGGGVIMTASAIDEARNFWEYSAFGNYFTRQKMNPADGYESVLSLPDFAEPGVDIVSLWPGKELAQCSGTSFAAAHLSGILLYGSPVESGKANLDKSAEKVGQPGQYDDTLKDPIGIKP